MSLCLSLGQDSLLVLRPVLSISIRETNETGLQSVPFISSANHDPLSFSSCLTHADTFSFNDCLVLAVIWQLLGKFFTLWNLLDSWCQRYSCSCRLLFSPDMLLWHLPVTVSRCIHKHSLQVVSFLLALSIISLVWGCTMSTKLDRE